MSNCGRGVFFLRPTSFFSFGFLALLTPVDAVFRAVTYILA